MEHFNSGIIPDPRPLKLRLATDWMTGGETGIPYEVILSDGKWRPYAPYGERQYTPWYDSMNCTNFSLHVVECQIIQLWPKLSEAAVTFFSQFLTDKNDIHSFRISKRAMGILSGTTKQGNYFQKVWDSIRKKGIIPDSMLPMGGKTWEEYMNPTLITKEMLDLGQESLKHIEIKYEFVSGYDEYGGFSPVELSETKKALKQAPLQIGIPIPCYHAIALLSLPTDTSYEALDHYEPFFRINDAVKTPVYCAVKGVVTLREPVATPEKPDTFTKMLSYGAKGEEVKDLQDMLKYEGFMAKNVLSNGNFFGITAAALKKWQLAHGLMDFEHQEDLTKIRFGQKSLALAKSLYK